MRWWTSNAETLKRAKWRLYTSLHSTYVGATEISVDEVLVTFEAITSLGLIPERFRQAIAAPGAFHDLDEEEAYTGANKFANRFGGPEGQVKKEVLQACIKDAHDFLQELGASARRTAAPLVPAVAVQLPNPEEAVEDEPEEVGDQAGMFVISVSGTGLGHRAKRARLHRRDGCYRARQLRFHSYEVVSFSPVPDNLYDSVCRACWPCGGPGEEISSDSSSSSSSRCTSPTEIL